MFDQADLSEGAGVLNQYPRRSTAPTNKRRPAPSLRHFFYHFDTSNMDSTSFHCFKKCPVEPLGSETTKHHVRFRKVYGSGILRGFWEVGNGLHILYVHLLDYFGLVQYLSDQVGLVKQLFDVQMGVFALPSPFCNSVKCVRETEILEEQQPPQGVLVCDHAGLVINQFFLCCAVQSHLQTLIIYKRGFNRDH